MKLTIQVVEAQYKSVGGWLLTREEHFLPAKQAAYPTFYTDRTKFMEELHRLLGAALTKEGA